MNIVREVVEADRARNIPPLFTTPPAKLYAALAKAQAEFPVIPKSKRGHGYNYAPLDAIQRAVRPILGKHGLGFTQYPAGDDLATVLFHESGESLSFVYPMRRVSGQRMNEMQAQGAVTTYAARYSLCLALGISADEDTGGHESGGEPRVSPDFKDARHDGMGTGVKGAKVAHDATPSEKAKAFADAIIAQLRDAKTARGRDGVWSRNEAVIDRLQASYPALYGDVLHAFEHASEAEDA